jgi:predicted DNA-binding transcriptional regulator AlpA
VRKAGEQELTDSFDKIVSDIEKFAMPALQSIALGKEPRLLRLPEVIQRVGIEKTKLYELQKAGCFPMSVQITSHAVG